VIIINGLAASFRDLREFVAAKRKRGEKLRIRGKGAARAMVRIQGASHFASLRSALRASPWFGGAQERLDALDRQLRSRHGVPLPVPEEVLQDEDCSVSCFWGGVSVRSHADGFVSLIGGTAGHAERSVTPQLLGALALKSRMQA